MLEEIKKRLQSLNYEVSLTDNILIEVIENKVMLEILDNINKREIPHSLNVVVVDRVCGLFLKEKYLSKSLTSDATDKMVTSISEGDIKMTFSQNKSQIEQLFDYLINDKYDFTPYRSVSW